MKKIRIAMIGAGFIADYHMRALSSLKNVEVTTICAHSLSSAQLFADKYNIKNTSDDALTLSSSPDLDGVILAIPNRLHAEYAIEFLKRGKDVFIEKPLAMDFKEGELIRKASEKSGSIIMTGHMWRFDDDVNYMRQLIKDGTFGDIIKTKGYGIHEDWGPEGWFVKKGLSGGGALIDMGVHAIDTVRFLLGDPEPISVYARLGTFFGNYDVDDSGIIIINWSNGTSSIIESGWWQPHSDGPEAATRLFGVKGYASIFPTCYKLKSDRFKETVPDLPAREDHCAQRIYDSEMTHFINCIRDRSTPRSGIEEGQVVMRITDAAYRSSETNCVITM
ncbi:Gfo/Idh/MocA family oxidoreductase [Oceanispirochaeta crateris]|uniref:Gfo/Idh/MocA family oxidoreductase n=1 Tax=Oceanispirochaeta crateris TaxID=2518645 RepID=A0A5C1QIP4_9SPIO|nr:Gfo/Idh/MocA family oxidoreductase [Oceanispirochaeta crateris]QEN08045.1 Gfo/Idh/MocA family oxidoreductase [Oceanispirochaeta crateris]